MTEVTEHLNMSRLRLNVHSPETGHVLELTPSIYTETPIVSPAWCVANIGRIPIFYDEFHGDLMIRTAWDYRITLFKTNTINGVLVDGTRWAILKSVKTNSVGYEIRPLYLYSPTVLDITSVERKTK